MDNKIIVHLCGGCGASVGEKALSQIKSGSGFSKLVFKYIDASDANYDKNKALGDLWLVKTKSHSKTAITGSGGDRARHVDDIAKSVKEYLDFNNIKLRNPNEFHLIVSSGSGGTGSVCAAAILKELMAINIPVIYLIVGDAGKLSTGGNLVYARNTLNTLATIDNYAVKANKAINVIYLNNSNFDNDSKIAESKANNTIFNIVSGISTFLSGAHESIDSQDMINIIDPSAFTSLKINPGVYGLTIAHGSPKAPNGAIPIMARTLTIPNISGDIEFGTYHQKQGIVKDENVLELYKDMLPMHMLMFANVLNVESQTLQDLVNASRDALSSINPHALKRDAESTETDDGMIV